MSFGAAAGRQPSAFPRIAGASPCPCGSGDGFDGCCGALIHGAPAPTAERLMRSRYTAFVLGDGRYLRLTWHPSTRPADLDLDPAQRWTGLEILEAHEGGSDDEHGEVEFRAHWQHGRERGVLHERSSFVRRGGRWVYLSALP